MIRRKRSPEEIAARRRKLLYIYTVKTGAGETLFSSPDEAAALEWINANRTGESYRLTRRPQPPKYLE